MTPTDTQPTSTPAGAPGPDDACVAPHGGTDRQTDRQTPDILALASEGKAADVVRDIRVRSLYSPYYFIKVVLGYRKLVDHLHHVELERFVTLWAQGALKQFIEWPRGFFKSTCFTIGCGVWGVLPLCDADSDYAIETLGFDEREWFARVALHDQDATQLYAFEIIDNAEKKVSEVKWHFEENSLFRSVFPEIAYDGSTQPWNTQQLRIRRVGARRRAPEGTFEAIGVGGALQSRHYSRVWEDDLVGEKAKKSASVMEQTIGWHGRLHGAFESAGQSPQFGVSNRWGYADLNSFIRENEPDFVFHTRSAIERDDDGREAPIFPEEYPVEVLNRIRHSGSMSSYDFSCQYMNTPIMPGENEVDVKKLHVYTVDGDGTIKCACGITTRASALRRYMHYDPYNAKGANSTSCPCVAVVGTHTSRHIFLLDYFLLKQGYTAVYDRIFHFNDVWRPEVFTYEDVGHQNMTEFHIRKISETSEYKTKHRRFPRLVGLGTHSTAKLDRIREGLFPHIEKGAFAYRSKQTIFLDMLQKFPNRVFDHDYDLLDALAQGAGLWRFPETDEARLERDAGEDEYLAQFNRPYGYGYSAPLGG
jgi:hypothetical protein